MSRFEFERSQRQGSPLEKHSMNQRVLKWALKGEKMLDLHRAEVSRGEEKDPTPLDIYNQSKDQRVLERVARVFAGYDGYDPAVLAAEVGYLKRRGILKS